MGAYYFILCFILINGITARKHRKWYWLGLYVVLQLCFILFWWFI